MADYDVYAVKKNDDGNITHCYTASYISEKFEWQFEAKEYVEKHCTKRTKREVINDITSDESNNIWTFKLISKDSKYEFKPGAKIHVVDNRYLRTDANSTTSDNLENILEID